ncbi:uncharacterized protein ATNIH1004_007690 [Aspergillus tanneri]|uniref:Uncharacterized protein n=1 Tax=Aspergillus tanneri TaxID=1220188 RepID=A0A5M9MMV0_9EURO|nr:uncharacterized protein ATNIH1004_007690 [Aspergillus tanneri]KAA8646263.1 hypothetical protein ATNIH1004_007690 [Aspergillus tanneri]
MPSPQRRSDHSGLSRRTHEPSQQHLSPFRRAQLESRAADRFDASRIPSPSNGSSSRQRRNLSNSGTLRGAFEAVSRYPTMSERDDLASGRYTLGTPNGRMPGLGPMSPESNPPNELAETYRQIDDEGSLVDLDPQENEAYIPRKQLRDSRGRGSSMCSTMRDNGLFTSTDAPFLDDVGESSYRRNSSDPVKDEQRLKRATSSRSPVLNKTGTTTALTSENLQRRELEDGGVSEEDDGVMPTLNLPSTWGSRGTRHRGWLRSITQPGERESKQVAEKSAGESYSKHEFERASRNDHLDRVGAGNRTAVGERSTNQPSRAPLSDAQNKLSSGQNDEKRTGGDHIPHTPIIVYKNSTFTKCSPTKRDSHDLLRKLSRTESPRQPQRQTELRTPEAPTIPEGRIYDKTPVVTGAWIDTPVTERVHRSSGKPSRDIMVLPPVKDKSTRSFEPTESRIVEESSTMDVPKKPPLVKPNLPKSALETVMQEFKADKEHLDVGDDTIESLQLILDETPNEAKTETEEDEAYEKFVMQKLGLAAYSKGHDIIDLDGLNEKLRSFSENISRVKKGLDGLEKQVELIPTSKKEVNSAHSHADESCTACATRNDSPMYTAILLPRLWKRDAVSRRIRPTRLGWFTIILFAWSYAESTMCDYYCHPFVSTVCSGNCLLRDAPRFPFVIPTMFWRWSHLSAVFAPVWAVMIAFSRLMAQLLGFWDGYVDEAPRYLNRSGEIRVHGSRMTSFPAATTTTRGFFGFAGTKAQEAASTNIPEAVSDLELDSRAETNWEVSMDDDEYL